MGAGHVHYINPKGMEVVFEGEFKEKTSTQCLGKAAEPTAEPGNFCVYAANEVGAASADALISNPGVPGSEEVTGTTGAAVGFVPTGSSLVGQGTWAVTAP
jgi:hypothetical protein